MFINIIWVLTNFGLIKYLENIHTYYVEHKNCLGNVLKFV